MVKLLRGTLSATLIFMALISFSQNRSNNTGFNIYDSSVIPNKRMDQHTEFLNNTYDFPAKPRNQWEIGIKGGNYAISGDVRSLVPQLGFGAHVRKAWGYVFSTRLEYTHGVAKGLNYASSIGYKNNPVWQAYIPGGPGSGGDPVTSVYYNYKTKTNELSLQGVITLNNVRFHKNQTGINFYLFGGLGGFTYDVKVDALNNNGQPYDFSAVPVNDPFANRKDIRNFLKDNVLDGDYESQGETDPLQPKLFGDAFRPAGVFGLGTAIKLSKALNLSIEHKVTVPKSDLLDGNQWQENWIPGPAQTRDNDVAHFTSLGLNLNLGSKSVEPLYWVNPLDYSYAELNNPRHMRFPLAILPDGDQDGVTDQFDLEPNTPLGCPVDSHGVSQDTDGDGVPDCKDKELITPTACQPVDADGVGKCPDPECCKNAIPVDDCTVKLGALPSIAFTGKSTALTADNRTALNGVAEKMRANPACKVVVSGYGDATKAAQQRSWERVNAVINYMVEKQGISADRFIFSYGQGEGDSNTVDLRAATAGEEGPKTVPAPHPNLRNK